jgi:hypothetical protein
MSTNTHLVTQQSAPHHNYVDSYLGSARPYAKSLVLPAYTVSGPSAVRKIELPYVSKFIRFFNRENDNSKAVYITFYDFNTAFAAGDYLEIRGGQFLDAYEVKCKDVWLRTSNNHAANFDIFAGCTNIPRHNFPDDLLTPIPAPGGVGVLAHDNRIKVINV